MPLPFEFDFKAPDYTKAFKWRAERLARIRAEPDKIPLLKVYYRDHPAQFIIDWGCTHDPRNVDVKLPAVIPFLLFPRQEEWVEWLIDNWRNRRRAMTEKSRDCGLSWLVVAVSATLCLHHEGLSIGFGSRKEEYVDKLGFPKAFFVRVRTFMSLLPVEFRGGWTEKHSPFMRTSIPGTGSTITGEAGDGIGRGDRTSIYFVDESPQLERPQLVEASLSATTFCRQDIGTPNGMGNPFAQKRHEGKIPVFTFHWRQDPRKDDAWYAKQEDELDAVTIAAEINIDYSGSVDRQLIPSKWVQAAVDAHVKLGVKPTGQRKVGFDVADRGMDLNAVCFAHGVLVEHAHAFSGKEDDIFGSVERVFAAMDEHSYDELDYDGDGLGAGVRGDARVLNQQRKERGPHLTPLKQIKVTMFRGSAAVSRPTARVEISPGKTMDRTNEDFFENMKAQAWWHLRLRFQTTWRALQGKEYDPTMLISLSSEMDKKELAVLCMELSQPTYDRNKVGKIVVDKAPDGARSPNLADAVMIRFAPSTAASVKISTEALAAAGPMRIGAGALAAAGGRRRR